MSHPRPRRRVKIVHPRLALTPATERSFQEHGVSLPVDLPEEHFQAAVRGAAEGYGWLYFHDRDSRTNPEGLPDVVALSPVYQEGAEQTCVLLLAELKAKGGKLTPAQGAWQERLDHVTHLAIGTFRPADWPALLALLGHVDPLPTMAPTSPERPVDGPNA